MGTLAAAIRRWEKLILVGLLVLVCGGMEVYYQLHHIGRGEDTRAALSCLAAPADPLSASATAPLTWTGCADRHDYQVLSTVRGEDPDGDCRAVADEFLGGPADEARVVVSTLREEVNHVDLRLCVVGEAGDTLGTVLPTAGSLRAAEPRLAITCIGPLGDDGRAEFRDCSLPHSGELAGLIGPGTDQDARCREAVARYVGDGALDRPDIRLRQVRRASGSTLCFVVDAAAGETLTASLKGLGSGPLPR